MYNSVIGTGVTIEEGAEVRDSIIMRETTIRSGARINKAILAEHVVIGENSELGVGEFKESSFDPRVYQSDLVTVGENSVIPPNVRIGKNTAIWGKISEEDFQNGVLESGGSIVKAGGLK